MPIRSMRVFKTFSIIDTLVGLICDLGEIDQASPLRTRLADEILRGQSARGNPARRIALRWRADHRWSAVDRFLAAFRFRIPPPQAVFVSCGV